MSYSNWLTDSITTDAAPIVPELSNPQNTPEPDGATLTIESNSDAGTLYSYSKTTPFGADEAANAAEIMANGVGQAPVVGTNTRVVTGQDPLTDHYAGWVQDSEGYGGDMVLVFNMGAGETLTIPGGAGAYDYEVNWGDLTDPDTWEAFTTVPATHTYTGDVAGEKEVHVRGTFSHVSFSGSADVAKLIRILNWGDTSWSDAGGAFGGAINLIEASAEVSNTSAVANMASMMVNWPSMLSPPDLSSFDTSNVTNMNRLMTSWTAMLSPPDLSSFDTSKVTNMEYVCYDWSSMGAVDIAIDKWQVHSAIAFTEFLFGSQLTTACYDRTLASWGNQTLAPGAASTTIHFGTSQYSLSSQGNRDLLEAQVAGIIDSGVAP